MSGTLLPDAAALAAGAPTAAALWRREIVATLRLALPLVFAQLGMIAINTTDILMMGWLGPQELAAGALGMNICPHLSLRAGYRERRGADGVAGTGRARFPRRAPHRAPGLLAHPDRKSVV